MLKIILFEPEIPPNTGNIMRLCANTGAELHLIHPLGFTLEEKQLKRAGLDYRDWANVAEHKDYESFIKTVKPKRVVAVETNSQNRIDAFQFQSGDALLFGPETRGLPQHLVNENPSVYLPMVKGSRSINLSNAVAISLFEAWRQIGWAGS